MRKTIIISCCAVVLVLAVISFLLPVMGNRTPTEPSSSAPVESSSGSMSSGEQYTIKEYQGNIAVYMNGVDRPFRITDVDVRTLPQLDQERLKSGIQVSGAEELNRLLEDYCS